VIFSYTELKKNSRWVLQKVRLHHHHNKKIILWKEAFWNIGNDLVQFKENAQSVYLEFQSRMMCVWTVIALLVGKFQLWSCGTNHLKSITFSFLQVLYISGSMAQTVVFRYPQRCTSKEFKWGEWSGHALGLPSPIQCSRNMLFKNIGTERENMVKNHHPRAII
jgi:hypothetical protein